MLVSIDSMYLIGYNFVCLGNVNWIVGICLIYYEDEFLNC